MMKNNGNHYSFFFYQYCFEKIKHLYLYDQTKWDACSPFCGIHKPCNMFMPIPYERIKVFVHLILLVKFMGLMAWWACWVYEWLCMDELDAQLTGCAVWSFSDSGPLALASGPKQGYIMMKMPSNIESILMRTLKKAKWLNSKLIQIVETFKWSGKRIGLCTKFRVGPWMQHTHMCALACYIRQSAAQSNRLVDNSHI